MLQAAPAATLVPQALVCVNRAASVPLMVTPLIVSGTLPVLVRVAVLFGGGFLGTVLTHVRSTGASSTEPLVIMTVPVIELRLSGTEVARSVTVLFKGREAGAVYVIAPPFAVMAGAMVPQAVRHAVPFCMSCQAMLFAVGSNPTAPTNCWATFKGTSALTGVIDTATARTPMLALP